MGAKAVFEDRACLQSREWMIAQSSQASGKM